MQLEKVNDVTECTDGGNWQIPLACVKQKLKSYLDVPTIRKAQLQLATAYLLTFSNHM